MARSENNLQAVFQDTADAIRAKTGGSAEICPRDFADEITNIPTGGGDTLPTLMPIETTQAKIQAALSNKVAFSNGNKFQFVCVDSNALNTNDCWIRCTCTIAGVTGCLEISRNDYHTGSPAMRAQFRKGESDYSVIYFDVYYYGYNILVLPEEVTIADAYVAMFTGDNIFVTSVDPR